MDYESDFDHDYPTEVIEMGHHPSAPPQYPGTNEKKQWANPK